LAILILLGCGWSALSLALLIRLPREYRRGEVTSATAVLLWPWHALNYALVIALSAERVWHVDVPLTGTAAGGVLVALGLAALAAGFLEFKSTSRLVGTETDLLVTSGIYRYGRHPQYAGIIATLVGAAILGESLAALAFALGLGAALLLYIPGEERFVARNFGERYRRYRERTPMLLGRPR
jgi:protein-S-isoprenylcysteine O-methyltransferase Ste14